MNRVGLALGTIPLIIGLVVAPAEVAASHLGEGIPDSTAVSASFVRSAQKQISDRIAAHLVAYDGSPIGDEEIEFRRAIEFLGPRLVLLGRGITNASGVAQIPIKATDARLRIDVRFAGDQRFAPSATTIDVEVPPASVQTRGRAGFEHPRPGVGLGPLASVMPMVIAGATLGVWVVLVALVLLTLRRIRRSQPNGVPRNEGQEAPS